MQAASPDEEALVQGAAMLGFKLLSRSLDKVCVHHAVLCCAVPCRAVLCCAAPCCVKLCIASIDAVICCAVKQVGCLEIVGLLLPADVTCHCIHLLCATCAAWCFS